MFRRKDENMPEGSAANGAGASHPLDAAPASAQAPVQQPAQPSYAPPRTAAVSEPARPAAAVNSYRPAPVSEFGRPAAAATSAPRASEPVRAGAQTSPSASSNSEKSAGATKSNRRVLTVGNDILLKGEIATCDRLVIEGRVEAKLSEVHTVEIAEVGSFKGTAEVEDAEISGVFEGDLIVRNRLVIYASGEVRGNISYGEIEIERGGRLTGEIKTGGHNQGSKVKSIDADKLRKDTAAA